MSITTGLYRSVSLRNDDVLAVFYIDEDGQEYVLEGDVFVALDGHSVGLRVIDGDMDIEPMESPPPGVVIPE